MTFGALEGKFLEHEPPFRTEYREGCDPTQRTSLLLAGPDCHRLPGAGQGRQLGEGGGPLQTAKGWLHGSGRVLSYLSIPHTPPGPLPGLLHLNMHLPPSLIPQRGRAVPEDGTPVPPVGIPRSGYPSPCNQQQRPTSWGPPLACAGKEQQSRPGSATKCRLPQHRQSQRFTETG